MNLFGLPSSEEKAVEYLQMRGILPSSSQCDAGHDMKLYFGTAIFWQCSKASCRKKVSIRKGTFFEDARLPFVSVLRFFYFWAFELSSIEMCSRELGLCNKTTIEWNGIIREVITADLMRRKTTKIGGPGETVEIDESVFTKRKNNSGRVLPQLWLLGGICRSDGRCFLTQIPDRKAETLLAAIKENVEEGTTIFTDCWKGYKSEDLEDAGFAHFTVNHSYNFVNPEDGTHTQNVERMWSALKWRNKRHRGTARHQIDSYLEEFIWRKMIQPDSPFDRLLDAIKSCNI